MESRAYPKSMESLLEKSQTEVLACYQDKQNNEENVIDLTTCIDQLRVDVEKEGSKIMLDKEMNLVCDREAYCSNFVIQPGIYLEKVIKKYWANFTLKKLIGVLKKKQVYGGEALKYSICVTTNGEHIFTYDEKSVLKLWDLDSYQIKQEFGTFEQDQTNIIVETGTVRFICNKNCGLFGF